MKIFEIFTKHFKPSRCILIKDFFGFHKKIKKYFYEFFISLHLWVLKQFKKMNRAPTDFTSFLSSCYFIFFISDKNEITS